MAIIISKNGADTQTVHETKFGLEDTLQEYVKNNPDIIPLYEISEDARLLILAREFGTASGPIDALGVDQDGAVYVIETKLYKNPDKRTVLAQALDYGASLWRHSGDATTFTALLEEKVRAQFGISLRDKLKEFFDTEDEQSLIDAMTHNITEGQIKFVILMDTVEDRLKDLITYVNQNSKFDVYAVDLGYYKHDAFEIVIPKLYGAEVKKDVAVRKEVNRFDFKKIVEWIEEFNLPAITIDSAKTIQSCVRFTTPFMDSLLPRQGDQAGGWGNGHVYYYEVRLDRNGSVRVRLALSSAEVDEPRMATMQQLIGQSERTPKQDWQFFVVKSWGLDYTAGDAQLKEQLREILSVGVEEFERGLR